MIVVALRYVDMKLMQQRIKKLLAAEWRYRVSDNSLMARVWYDDLVAQGKSVSNMTGVEVLLEIQSGNLTNWETATRVRRKLQSKHKELRDDKVYKGRKDEEERWRNRFSPNVYQVQRLK